MRFFFLLILQIATSLQSDEEVDAVKKQERAGVLKRRREEETKEPRRYTVDVDDRHGKLGIKASKKVKDWYLVSSVTPESRAERLDIKCVSDPDRCLVTENLIQTHAYFCSLPLSFSRFCCLLLILGQGWQQDYRN